MNAYHIKCKQYHCRFVKIIFGLFETEMYRFKNLTNMSAIYMVLLMLISSMKGYDGKYIPSNYSFQFLSDLRAMKQRTSTTPVLNLYNDQSTTTPKTPISSTTPTTTTGTVSAKSIVLDFGKLQRSIDVITPEYAELRRQGILASMSYKVLGYLLDMLVPLEDYSRNKSTLVENIFNFIRRGLETLETYTLEAIKMLLLRFILINQRRIFEKIQQGLFSLASFRNSPAIAKWIDALTDQYQKSRDYVVTVIRNYVFSWLGIPDNVISAFRILDYRAS